MEVEKRPGGVQRDSRSPCLIQVRLARSRGIPLPCRLLVLLPAHPGPREPGAVVLVNRSLFRRRRRFYRCFLTECRGIAPTKQLAAADLVDDLSRPHGCAWPAKVHPERQTCRERERERGTTERNVNSERIESNYTVENFK